MKYSGLLILLLLVGCGDNHIVQRGSADYYPLRADAWWLYAGQGDTILIEVEPEDTLLGTACFPVSRNGVAAYLAEYAGAIAQYVAATYNFAGEDYTVFEGFVVRIELPLVQGNIYHHLLADSITVAGQSIHARYEVTGEIIGFDFEAAYGDVYEVITTTIRLLSVDGNEVADTTAVTEYYAPGVGMIRFRDGTTEYELIEYNIP